MGHGMLGVMHNSWAPFLFSSHHFLWAKSYICRAKLSELRSSPGFSASPIPCYGCPCPLQGCRAHLGLLLYHCRGDHHPCVRDAELQSCGHILPGEQSQSEQMVSLRLGTLGCNEAVCALPLQRTAHILLVQETDVTGCRAHRSAHSPRSHSGSSGNQVSPPQCEQ